MIYSIYKATNTINGKSYIGIDVRWPHRKSCHKSDARKGSMYHFHKAIRKYGEDSFEWELLFQSEQVDLILDAEVFYIKMFDSFGTKGYNGNIGGGGMAGRKHTETSKEKMSETRRKKSIKPWLGKNRSEETKRKIGAKNSIKTKEMWQDPVRREKMLQARKNARL